MKLCKFACLTGLYLLLVTNLSAQVVATTPELPVAEAAVTIVFNAALGNQGLMNYAGDDVYAHTGVITNTSTSGSDWKYVKAGWSTNLLECKLTKTGANTYQITFSPSIRAFYGVPESDTILKMAFVFRNAAGSVTGRDVGGADIFTTVYREELNASFASPAEVFTLTGSGSNIPVVINAMFADSMHLYLDGELLAVSTGLQLSHSIIASGNRLHTLVAKAWGNDEMVTDTAWYLVNGTPATIALPAGAKDGISYPDDQSATFVLYAPYKGNAYLIGDFNNWMPDSAYLMNRDGDRFWQTISGLEAGQEYAFQYLIDGNLRIADPYSEKILDPWNDKYIPADIYPDLKPYPAGKTTEAVGVIQTARPEYSWEATGFTPPDQANLVIYELLIRDFTSKQDIKTVTDTLSYLKRLGVNAIELMPFNEFEGNNSWGYNPSFYFATDKAYGTPDDYKKFIDECHKNGIAVIMDMVLNHSYGQSPLLRMYFDGSKPTAQNPWYNVTSPNPVYSWGYDFNHQSQATRDFVDRVNTYWLTEFKVDGFRFDFTKGLTNTAGDGWAYDAQRISILKRIADVIWDTNPDAYVILEHFTDNGEEKILADYGCLIWGNMNSKYSEAAMGYNEGGKSDLGWMSYVNRGWNDAHLVGYMESHDEERLVYKNLTFGNKAGTYDIKKLQTALARQRLASCFFYTIPGPKMLYEFGELGFDFSINSFGDRTAIKPPHWEYYNEPDRRALFNLTAELIRLKTTESLFSGPGFTLDVYDSIKHIRLTDGFGEVDIIGNFGMLAHTVPLTFGIPGRYYSHFTGDSIQATGAPMNISLQPGGFHLFTNIKFDGFGSVIASLPGNRQSNTLSLSPNPAENHIFLNTSGVVEFIEIFSLDGRLQLRSDIRGDPWLDVSGLTPGVYLLKAGHADGRQEMVKFVKK